jgi:uncharacterized protein YecE (DUF72 family)
MRVRVGTSGFSYPEWVGTFYPEDLPQDGWLPHYASRLGAVEINNSFYRVPRSAVVEGWRDAVGADFRIVLKVTRRVTHFARLKPEADEAMHWMWRATAKLAERRGPMLFQLPPNMKADLERLDTFLGRLPDEATAAFEFRHPSWEEAGVADVLARHGAALCVADGVDDGPPADEDGAPPPDAPLPRTAAFGYLRLRRPDYDDAALDAWAARVRAAGWDEVYAFFKHEEAGAGPALAARFAARF